MPPNCIDCNAGRVNTNVARHAGPQGVKTASVIGHT